MIYDIEGYMQNLSEKKAGSTSSKIKKKRGHIETGKGDKRSDILSQIQGTLSFIAARNNNVVNYPIRANNDHTDWSFDRSFQHIQVQSLDRSCLKDDNK